MPNVVGENRPLKILMYIIPLTSMHGLIIAHVSDLLELFSDALFLFDMGTASIRTEMEFCIYALLNSPKSGSKVSECYVIYTGNAWTELGLLL